MRYCTEIHSESEFSNTVNLMSSKTTSGQWFTLRFKMVKGHLPIAFYYKERKGKIVFDGWDRLEVAERRGVHKKNILSRVPDELFDFS